MAIHDNWESLTVEAQVKCGVILDKYVAPVATRIVKKHILSDIYDVYSPAPGAWVDGSTYARRHLLENTLYHTFSKEYEILITSNATASKSIVKGYSFHNRRPGSFLKMLENGNMGIWRKGFPRPAISNAQKEIDESTAVSNAIRDGIDKLF